MTSFFHALGVAQPWQLVGATMLFLMLPGPGTFCLLTCSGKHGTRGGFAALAGLMLADAMLMLLAAMGIAALLRANPLLFKAVQYAGAGYLCWLGWRLVFSPADVAAAVPFTRAADFRRGFLVTLVNPKAIVFYMAFFPLFVDPHLQRGAMTFIAMVGLISCCTLFYGSLLVVGGNAVARRLKHNRRIAQLGTKVAGVILIGFGIKMTTN
jgi:leucine efflux protein